MSSYWENCIGFAICLKNGKFTANLRQTYTSFLRRKNEANERHITTIYGDLVAREFPADDAEEASAVNGRAQSSVHTFLKRRK